LTTKRKTPQQQQQQQQQQQGELRLQGRQQQALQPQ
jgi:hypothetical protein